jgi:hypothetical protein
MKSLRARLLAGIICSFACLLIVFGLVLDIAIEYTLTREFDFYLESVARTLAAGIEIEGKHINVKLVPEALQDIPLVEGELFSQYWTSDGTVLAKSGNLSGHNLPRFRGDQGFGKTQPFILPDGRHARAAGMKISLAPGAQRQQTGGSSNDERHLILAVARDATDLESHVRQLRWLLLAAGAVTIIIGSLVSIAVVHRSLRPLSRVAEAIETI